MPRFPSIPDNDIIYYGYREEPFFSSEIICGGLSNRKNLIKYFQLSQPTNLILVGYELFFVQSSVDAFTKQLRKKLHLGGKQYVELIVKGCFKAGENLIKVSKEQFV